MNRQPVRLPAASWPLLLALLSLAWLAPTSGQGDDAVYGLAVGDTNRKARQVELVLDGIRDTRTGEIIDTSQLAERLDDASFVLIGEDHTNMDFHRVQLQVIKALHNAGRSVVIGLEMFPYMDQPKLDRWSSGELSEGEFLEVADWYRRWGYPWGYYREIFIFARDQRLPMWGLNAPREIISQVRKDGWDNMPADAKAYLPPSINTDSAEHMTLFKAYFQTDDTIHGTLPDAAVQSMFEAQVSWDAVMAYNAVRAVEAHPGAVAVVLAGGGHVAYGLGIARQLAVWHDGRAALVMPVPVRLADGSPLGRVQASYGDYIWGLPAATYPVYPVLGMATAKRDQGLAVLDVEADSTAARAGVRAGDLIVSLNDEPVAERGVYNRIMARLSWGDRVTLGLQRDEQSVTASAVLRRQEQHHE